MKPIFFRLRSGLLLALALCLSLGTKAQPAATEKPLVWVLATGGTIAGRGADATQSAYLPSAVTVDTLLASVPELAGIARLQGEQIFQIASQDLTPAHWLQLSRRVNELLSRDSVAGVVITHGTDTQEETAYFLQLTVKSRKPVVLTASMRPPTSLSADGPRNLYEAVLCAASPLSAGHGVMVVMNDRILSADNLTKGATLDPEAFCDPEFGPMGRIYNNRVIFTREPLRKHTFRSEFDVSGLETLPSVEVIGAYAGSSSLFIRAAVQAGVKGIVFAGVGNGNLSAEMLGAAASARREGMAIVRSSRIMRGPTTEWNEVDDEALGFAASWYANPYRARVLLMLALTRTNDPREIRRIFREY